MELKTSHNDFIHVVGAHAGGGGHPDIHCAVYEEKKICGPARSMTLTGIERGVAHG